ncbi:hypothetical protein HLB23_36425 [Nocardia uniformis]|uniref:Uncharacterized protein n=1 Tax=Nocardia uniformis TaxID=53432 RepID=A0A849CH93_9NOCA|nr:hypothetical protein [Nocardia uniformis]NNH75279.1 hypothetical protein [Nocardia uniformis]
MYRIVHDEEVVSQIAALPVDSLDAFAELCATLSVAPWNGEPLNPDNPDGAVRCWVFMWPTGSGQAIFMIDERDRAVHILRLQWLA